MDQTVCHLVSIIVHELKADTSSFAPAEEIGDYFIGVARKYDVYDHIQFDSLVSGAVWNEDQARWSIEVSSKTSTVPAKVQADVFVNAGGILNDWKWPDIEGLSSFEGALIHTASWVRSQHLTFTVVHLLIMERNFRIIAMTGQTKR